MRLGAESVSQQIELMKQKGNTINLKWSQTQIRQQCLVISNICNVDEQRKFMCKNKVFYIYLYIYVKNVRKRERYIERKRNWKRDWRSERRQLHYTDKWKNDYVPIKNSFCQK